MIMWDSRVMQLVGFEESCHTLSCRFSNYGDNFTWVFMGVYGPTKRDLREELWEDLGALRGRWEDLWYLGVYEYLWTDKKGSQGRIVGRPRGSQREVGRPMVLGGDFNVLRSPDERNMEGRWSGAMRRFSHVIDDLVLKDLPLKGDYFT